MHKAMTILGALAALALLAPSAASAKEYTGSIEFSFGFGGTDKSEPDGADAVESDTGGLIGIIPGVDRMLGKSVGLGAEFGFIWLGMPDEDAQGNEINYDRSLVLNPNIRLRMSFPIVKKVTFDGMIAGGPAIWMGNDSVPNGTPLDETRFGYAFRFNFGGSYMINDAVAGFLSLGYYTTTSFGDDITLTQSTVPLNIGLRGGF